jgi:predicted deacylase
MAIGIEKNGDDTALVNRKRNSFQIGGAIIEPGSQATVEFPLSLLSDHTQMNLTVKVIHGRYDGPILIVNSAIHGDEINGVEIIRRLLGHRSLKRMRGTLIAVPIVNVYGFLSGSRYLPDRRDLNRSFPGSDKGSLASRLAYIFLNEIVFKATHGIDLHTGAIHRSNFPQIRGHLANSCVNQMAHAFGVPVILNAAFREGSLRKSAHDSGIPYIVFEGGEALRFDETTIRAGFNGILNTMRALNMTNPKRYPKQLGETIIARSSAWVRASEGGIFRSQVKLGQRIKANSVLALIADPFGQGEVPVSFKRDGVIIGQTNLPRVNQGDGLYNIALVDDPDAAAEAVDVFLDDWEAEES